MLLWLARVSANVWKFPNVIIYFMDDFLFFCLTEIPIVLSFYESSSGGC